MTRVVAVSQDARRVLVPKRWARGEVGPCRGWGGDTVGISRTVDWTFVRPGSHSWGPKQVSLPDRVPGPYRDSSALLRRVSTSFVPFPSAESFGTPGTFGGPTSRQGGRDHPCE